jgi:hypothetical protein|tara:strand:- start:122 stop:376 length:255 start_codon:yes stop_codon:yes gene_type:complete
MIHIRYGILSINNKQWRRGRKPPNNREEKMRKKIEGYAVVITWRYGDGSWNTETLNQDELPDSFLDYLNEYERVENEQASKQKG